MRDIAQSKSYVLGQVGFPAENLLSPYKRFPFHFRENNVTVIMT